jgi:hypothetical protein
MKTIATKYLGPSNFRGSRIKASDEDRNQITVQYNGDHNQEPNHAAACLALCRKMGWKGRLQGGHTKAGMVWTFIDRKNQVTAR